jgi:hypothetical protein
MVFGAEKWITARTVAEFRLLRDVHGHQEGQWLFKEKYPIPRSE